MLAASLAGAAAITVAAWLVISTGRDDADAARSAAVSPAPADVRVGLSSTADAAARDNRRETSLPPDAAAVRSQSKASAGEHRGIERAAALLAAFLIPVCCVAGVGWRRAAQECDALARKLQAELHHDPLTGLPNRRLFSDWLSFAIGHARRENAHVGVLFIEVSGCPAVGRLHGAEATEALLVEVARRFRATSREGDVFARLDATQFALATPNARDVRELGAIAQRLRDAVTDPAQPPLADTPIGVSIGIALHPDDAADSAGVLAAANAAMYAARRAGRNHVAFNAIAA